MIGVDLVAMTFEAYTNRGTMQPCYAACSAAFHMIPAYQLRGTSYLECRTGFRESITASPAILLVLT